MPQKAEARRVSPEVTKLIERELRTLTKLVPGATKETVREYRELAERAAKLQVPQSHAAILAAAKQVTPAEALRPTSKAVRSLMQASRAIKSGRLPFLPKETRREAQRLLDELFGRRRAGQIAKSPQIPRTIETQRLIPAAVSGMVEAARAKDSPPPPLLSSLRHTMETPLAALPEAYRPQSAPLRVDAQGRTPVAARDLPRLAQALPGFAGTGIAVGAKGAPVGDSDAFLSHAGENVVPITSDDVPLDAADLSEDSSAGSMAAPKSNSTRQPSGNTKEGAATQTAGGGSAGAGAAKSQARGPVKIEGTMNIPELGDAVGKFQGFMTDSGAL